MASQEEVLEQFGARVRALRTDRNLSQEALGFECNLSQTYISEVESGKRNISLRNIDAIARALQVSLADLFTGLG